MNAKIKRFARHYLYSLFAQSWNGAWSAADCAMGLAAGAMVSTSIDFPTWQGVLCVFATTFIRRALTYLGKNPIPEKIPESPQGDSP